MRVSGYHKISQSLLVSLTAVLFSFALWQGGYLEDLENKAWDVVSRFFATPSEHTADIVLILLDQQSLDWAKDNLGISWPWPRELHAAVIRNCHRRGAVAIGVDVLFTEPSMYGVSDDAALDSAIADMPALALGSVSAGMVSGAHHTWPATLPRPRFTLANTSRPASLFPKYLKALLPIPEIASHATVLSNVNQHSDKDGIYRRFHPFVFFAGVPLPTLGIATFLATIPDASLTLNDSTLHIGSHSLPLDHQGRMVLRFRGPAYTTFQALSTGPLIHDEMLGQQGDSAVLQDYQQDLRGKYVFYGFSAPGLLDLRPTPVGGKTAGVELHATTLDNLLTGDFIRPIKPVVQAICYALCILTTAWMMTWFTRPAAQVLQVLLYNLFPIASFISAYSLGFQLQVIPFEAAMVVTILLSVILNYLTEGRERRFITHSFKHYLSPDVIEELIEHPAKLQLGGERKEISILFSDLQGFTTISENLDPETLTTLLNTYLTAMTDIILEERGTIDKYEGDAIIAFWNAPLPVDDHAVRAVRAALRCQQELARLRPILKEQCGHELHMRIGVNTGTAVVGNLGSSRRFDYTMLGDAVNLASRLEGVNKQFGSWTLISSTTRQLVQKRYPCREMAKVTVVGRHEPVTIFEPFMPEAFERQKEMLATFGKGLEAFYCGNIPEAMQLFSRIAGQDPPSEHYRLRCQQLITAKEDDGPWRGVWDLSSK